jgi:hypothetical protein
MSFWEDMRGKSLKTIYFMLFNSLKGCQLRSAAALKANIYLLGEP